MTESRTPSRRGPRVLSAENEVGDPLAGDLGRVSFVALEPDVDLALDELPLPGLP